MTGPVSGQLSTGPAGPAPLPPLRPDLWLLPGPADTQGEPTWTLHDPLNNRFFSLGWLEREVNRR
ncbi:hypothetical protein CCP1ISM_5690002 [Azospirillaceae bacterium]